MTLSVSSSTDTLDISETAGVDTVSTPLATLYGEPVTQLPEDLFIPPDALAVFLETFQGPLDLLLYLIRKQNIDILDIPMAALTAQYLQYIEWMEDSRFELAADYLLMAAMLIDIKARLLLPKPVDNQAEEEDPRSELVRRLLAYEQAQQQAQALAEQAVAGESFCPIHNLPRGGERTVELPSIAMRDLSEAWERILCRASLNQKHVVARESLSVRAHMVSILQRLSDGQRARFVDLFEQTTTVAVVVVHFLAILELARERLIEFIQAMPGSTIYLKLQSADDVC